VVKEMSKKAKRAQFFSGSIGIYLSSLRKEAGFTLIEIMIILAVLGILALIGVPRVNNLVGAYRLKGAANLVLADLQNAKMTAIQQNRAIQIYFNSTGYSFVQTDTGTAIFSRNLTADYPNITLTNSGGSSLTIASTGMTTNSTVTLQGSQGSQTISVLWTGGMKLN
jgi:type IV fimbrial biogenesis protein FimT